MRRVTLLKYQSCMARPTCAYSSLISVILSTSLAYAFVTPSGGLSFFLFLFFFRSFFRSFFPSHSSSSSLPFIIIISTTTTIITDKWIYLFDRCNKGEEIYFQNTLKVKTVLCSPFWKYVYFKSNSLSLRAKSFPGRVDPLSEGYLCTWKQAQNRVSVRVSTQEVTTG